MNASDFQQIYISIDFFFCSACVIFMIKFGSYMYICTWLCSLSFFTVLYLFCFHVLCDYAVHDWDQESLKCRHIFAITMLHTYTHWSFFCNYLNIWICPCSLITCKDGFGMVSIGNHLSQLISNYQVIWILL